MRKTSKKIADAYKAADETVAAGEVTVEHIAEFPIDDVLPNPDAFPEPLQEEAVKSIMRSIAGGILIHPLTINKDNVLLAGRHRLEACKRLLHDVIEVKRVTCSPERERLILIEENTRRAKLTHNRKMFEIERYLSPLVKRAGRPKKEEAPTEETLDKEPTENANICAILRKFSSLKEAAVYYGYFDSTRSYDMARSVSEKCIPEVIDLIDKGVLSYGYAEAEIAPIDRRAQKTALHVLLQNPKASADKKGIKRAVRERLQSARLEKTGTPRMWKPIADIERYKVARAMPNWNKEKLEDLKTIPVGDYMADDGILCILCPNRYLGEAFKLMWMWGFNDDTTFSHSPCNAYADHLRYRRLIDDAMHVVVGSFKTDNPKLNAKQMPIGIRDDAAASVLELVDDMFRNAHTEGYLLDVCATQSSDGWVSLKQKYGLSASA